MKLQCRYCTLGLEYVLFAEQQCDSKALICFWAFSAPAARRMGDEADQMENGLIRPMLDGCRLVLQVAVDVDVAYGIA